MKLLAVMRIAGLVLLVAGAANAQMGGMMGQGPRPRGLFNPIVGQGAQYEIQGGNGNKAVVEIDIVGKESVNGKDGFWFETVMSNPQTGNMVMKILTVPDGANTSVTKMVMQMGNRPPMEMPAQMTQMAQGAHPQATDIRSQADDVGSESVTVPAGTFSCEHYRMKDGSGDFWISDKISPYGLIKQQGKNDSMVLMKVVTDAKDQITGTPVPFNPAAMMGQQPPR
jgi:hypothetical protein